MWIYGSATFLLSSIICAIFRGVSFPTTSRRQEWLSARVIAFFVSDFFWLSVAGFLFRLPYSSFRLEDQCIYFSQARSRGFRRRSVYWGSRVPIQWRPARESAFQRSSLDDSASIFPASPGSNLHHVLLARWGGLFYWSRQVAVYPFDVRAFSRFRIWLGASSFRYDYSRSKKQVRDVKGGYSLVPFR